MVLNWFVDVIDSIFVSKEYKLADNCFDLLHRIDFMEIAETFRNVLIYAPNVYKKKY